MQLLRAFACALVFTPLGIAAAAAPASADPAATLLLRHEALKEELDHNRFRRPLHMDSSERAGGVRGEIFARVDSAFALAGAELAKPAQWCAILTLHLNTKYCRPSAEGGATLLHLRIGRKFDQPVEQAYPLDFAYHVVAATATYLHVNLDASEGPLGTRDYRIVLEATPTQDGRTFIRFAYSYSYGLAAQIAMQVYLGTIGRDKVGFTVIGTEPDGRPRYIRGMRGVIERNTMRYFLAIEAFIGALPIPAQLRLERSLRAWFAAIETYPRQLHEMEEVDYLAMKRREYARQR